MARIRLGFIMMAFLVCGIAAGCSEDSDGGPTPGARPDPKTSAAAGASPAAAGGDSAATDSAAASAPSSAPAEGRSPEALVAAGRAIYNANCIACHAMDPRIDGALGPAAAGASAELIAARVLRAEYPEGYTPKRETRVMIPLPHLESKLPELTAYLQSLGG